VVDVSTFRVVTGSGGRFDQCYLCGTKYDYFEKKWITP